MDVDGQRREDGRGDAPRVSRRAFIKYGGVAAAGSVVGAQMWTTSAQGAPKPPPDPILIPKGPKPDLSVLLRRRPDQLRLIFEFYNWKLDAAKANLVKKLGSKDSFVVVVFLPQAVMEEALFEYDPNLQTGVPKPPGQDDPEPVASEGLLPPPLGSRVSGASRLAFRVPGSNPVIPYNPDGLLDWSGWTPSVVPVARGSEVIQPIGAFELTPRFKEPGPTDTALELPWWLLISPHAQTGWAHSLTEVTHDGITELWHTRYGGKAPGGQVDEDDAERKTVRAIWARDPTWKKYLANPGSVVVLDGEDGDAHFIGMPFRTPLSQRDRFDIVTSTADYEHKVSKGGYRPLPAYVDTLMLTSLGAWLDLNGAWEPGAATGQSGTSLESWRHRATLGRDHYVRIVRAGFLFPFGHAASLIKVTERKFKINAGRKIAYLFQRYFLIVRQRRVDYPNNPFLPFGGRAFPFTRVDITTRITPNLDPPAGEPGIGSATEAFVPRVGGAPFRFHMVGTDMAGRTIDFQAPVAFVDLIRGVDLTDMETMRDWYAALAEGAPERSFAVQGQNVAVAEPDVLGSTDLEIHRFTLGAAAPGVLDQNAITEAGQPAFFPTMALAETRIAAAEIAAGGGLGALPLVHYDLAYVVLGFAGAGPGEVFVNTVAPAGMDFSAMSAGDRSGGVITPNVGISALSRKSGTVGGDPAKFQSGDFDPSDYFGALTANLLGDITLQDVIEQITGADFDLADPLKKSKVLQLNTRDEPNAIVTELMWKPKLKDLSDLFIASLGGKDATLDLSATAVVPKNAPDAATFTVIGDLKNFQVGLLPGARFILVQFDRLRFQAETGKKTDVDVDIREVVFDGPLRFINDLKDYLSFSAGGFSIALKPTHLEAGFELPLPAITVGVFSLANISFVAGVVIPFTGDPIRFRFGFSGIENPFLITVMIFGGGGHFKLGIGVDGVEEFQAGFEFGASLALDIGVASGSVSLTAGIYFAIGVANPPDNPDGVAELKGFLKLKGEVCVIGLITITLLMEASFTYIAPPVDKAIAKAILIVEIDLTIWSGSVEIEYEKKFGGSNDPTFGDTLTQTDWDAYSDAFAPVGV